MALGNARYDQLPAGIPKSGDIFSFRDQADGVTKRVDVDQFLDPVGNFEWVTDNDPGYAINAIVTYSGNIYQSLANNNLNFVPSARPDKWLLLTRGVAWQVWAAGAFLENEVFVLYLLDGEMHIMRLVDAARPYNSTNFVTEYDAGDWISVTQNVTLQNGTQGSGTLALDFNHLKRRLFQADLIEPKTWSLTKSGNAMEFSCGFSLDALHAQTFPAAFKIVNSENADWDQGTGIWTPYSAGSYRLEAFKKSAIWICKIFGPTE